MSRISFGKPATNLEISIRIRRAAFDQLSEGFFDEPGVTSNRSDSDPVGGIITLIEAFGYAVRTLSGGWTLSATGNMQKPAYGGVISSTSAVIEIDPENAVAILALQEARTTRLLARKRPQPGVRIEVENKLTRRLFYYNPFFRLAEEAEIEDKARERVLIAPIDPRSLEAQYLRTVEGMYAPGLR